ncbi:phosphomannomutase/phosphoglucomutase [Patescibacteria group bacterium]
MEINQKIFKAYDIRGIYPREINEEAVYAIGRAFVIFSKAKKIVVGRDIRLSSPALAKSLIRGIIDQGADVIDIGLITTPMMYFSVVEYGFDGGIIVTASHNSREFNGLKIVDKNSIPFSEDIGLKDIQEIISQDKLYSSEVKGEIIKKEILSDYINNIFKFVQEEEVSNFKIVIDAGNGMAGLVLPELFNRLQYQVIPLFWEPDGSFTNHLPNPSEENLKKLIEEVDKNKANLGIAFDGDADRVVFIDEKGEIIKSDYIIALMAKIFLVENPSAKIICDSRVGWIVRDIIKENNGQMIISRAGHSFIKKKMHEEKAVFAGELSGHYYLGANNNFESCFIVMLFLLKLMSQENKKISEIIKPLKKYYNTGELNFEVDGRKKVLENVESFYTKGNISYLDGLSIEYDDWWFNLRLSNTEPVMRLVIEAKKEGLLKEKKDELIGLIKGKLLN